MDKGEREGGWSGTLIHFRKCLADMFLDRRLWEELSFESVLAAGITEIVIEDLKRSVSCIFHRVRARHFTNSVIPATAAQGHQSWRRKTS